MRSSLFCRAHAPRAPAVWAGPEQKRAERSYSAGDVQLGVDVLSVIASHASGDTLRTGVAQLSTAGAAAARFEMERRRRSLWWEGMPLVWEWAHRPKRSLSVKDQRPQYIVSALYTIL